MIGGFVPLQRISTVLRGQKTTAARPAGGTYGRRARAREVPIDDDEDLLLMIAAWHAARRR